jgi:uncharacterized protein YndB with AHSA1/START domain
MNDDLANRFDDIHWPDGFSPDGADLFAHNEVFIDAPCSTVWQLLIAVERWPQWYPNSHDVRILNDRTGVLRDDSRFQWTTFGIDILSEIFEFVPDSRIGWHGNAPGLQAYHAWRLLDDSNRCHVIMEEAAKGPAAIEMRDSDPDGLHKAHDLWNSRLKLLAEGR